MPDTHPYLKNSDKLYYRIGEVGKITSVPLSVLRFWETEFRQIKPKRTESGQRLYRKSDVELILTIKHLLYEKKYTIPGAIQRLKSSKTNNAPKVKKVQAITLNDLRAELESIRSLLSA